MSSAIAVGVVRRNRVRRPLWDLAQDLGVYAAGCESTTDPVVREICQSCKEWLPEATWCVLVDANQAPDLDLDYEVPTLMDGPLGAWLESLVEDDDVSNVALLMFDFGTSRRVRHGPFPLSKIRETLAEMYELGGADGHAFHLFSRAAG